MQKFLFFINKVWQAWKKLLHSDSRITKCHLYFKKRLRNVVNLYIILFLTAVMQLAPGLQHTHIEMCVHKHTHVEMCTYSHHPLYWWMVADTNFPSKCHFFLLVPKSRSWVLRKWLKVQDLCCLFYYEVRRDLIRYNGNNLALGRRGERERKEDGPWTDVGCVRHGSTGTWRQTHSDLNNVCMD